MLRLLLKRNDYPTKKKDRRPHTRFGVKEKKKDQRPGDKQDYAGREKNQGALPSLLTTLKKGAKTQGSVERKIKASGEKKNLTPTTNGAETRHLGGQEKKKEHVRT